MKTSSKNICNKFFAIKPMKSTKTLFNSILNLLILCTKQIFFMVFIRMIMNFYDLIFQITIFACIYRNQQITKEMPDVIELPNQVVNVIFISRHQRQLHMCYERHVMQCGTRCRSVKVIFLCDLHLIVDFFFLDSFRKQMRKIHYQIFFLFNFIKFKFNFQI